MSKMQAHRYHDICAGHRVVGHESKCQHLHGHNYRVHFYCEAPKLDKVGRVVDFSVIKDKLCMWIENHWDHKFLAWKEDPLLSALNVETEKYWENGQEGEGWAQDKARFDQSMVWVPFNPTAENMAEYLIRTIAPRQLIGTGVICTKITIEETAKCAVTVEL